MNKKIIFVLALVIALFAIGSVSAGFFDFFKFGDDSSSVHVDENGQYCTVNEVAAYIKEYHKLPSNYITKKDFRFLSTSYDNLINTLFVERGRLMQKEILN